MKASESPVNVFLGMFDRLGADSLLSRLGDTIYRLGPKNHAEPFVLVPGVREMLAQLRTRYPLSIVTARSKRIAQHFLDQFEPPHQTIPRSGFVGSRPDGPGSGTYSDDW